MTVTAGIVPAYGALGLTRARGDVRHSRRGGSTRSTAFDFAYTGGFPGPPEWEFWHGPEDAASWWRERFGVDVPVSAADYARARERRRRIAQSVIAVSHGQRIPAEASSCIDTWAALPAVPRS